VRIEAAVLRLGMDGVEPVANLVHACLGHDDATSLRDVVRGGGSDEELVRTISAAVSGKRAGHVFAEKPPAKHMIGMGG